MCPENTEEQTLLDICSDWKKQVKKVYLRTVRRASQLYLGCKSSCLVTKLKRKPRPGGGFQSFISIHYCCSVTKHVLQTPLYQNPCCLQLLCAGQLCCKGPWLFASSSKQQRLLTWMFLPTLSSLKQHKPGPWCILKIPSQLLHHPLTWSILKITNLATLYLKPHSQHCVIYMLVKTSAIENVVTRSAKMQLTKGWEPETPDNLFSEWKVTQRIQNTASTSW